MHVAERFNVRSGRMVCGVRRGADWARRDSDQACGPDGSD